mmetsp:Transcript_32496/g.93582  ORF Transcript_32496/g.93582 Transcript_32496/m.93582 type:complete len:221 (+) Transcript_32496:542-1204(+)
MPGDISTPEMSRRPASRASSPGPQPRSRTRSSGNSSFATRRNTSQRPERELSLSRLAGSVRAHQDLKLSGTPCCGGKPAEPSPNGGAAAEAPSAFFGLVRPGDSDEVFLSPLPPGSPLLEPVLASFSADGYGEDEVGGGGARGGRPADPGGKADGLPAAAIGAAAARPAAREAEDGDRPREAPPAGRMAPETEGGLAGRRACTPQGPSPQGPSPRGRGGR